MTTGSSVSAAILRKSECAGYPPYGARLTCTFRSKRHTDRSSCRTVLEQSPQLATPPAESPHLSDISEGRGSVNTIYEAGQILKPSSPTAEVSSRLPRTVRPTLPGKAPSIRLSRATDDGVIGSAGSQYVPLARRNSKRLGGATGSLLRRTSSEADLDIGQLLLHAQNDAVHMYNNIPAHLPGPGDKHTEEVTSVSRILQHPSAPPTRPLSLGRTVVSPSEALQITPRGLSGQRSWLGVDAEEGASVQSRSPSSTPPVSFETRLAEGTVLVTSRAITTTHTSTAFSTTEAPTRSTRSRPPERFSLHDEIQQRGSSPNEPSSTRSQTLLVYATAKSSLERPDIASGPSKHQGLRSVDDHRHGWDDEAMSQISEAMSDWSLIKELENVSSSGSAVSLGNSSLSARPAALVRRPIVRKAPSTSTGLPQHAASSSSSQTLRPLPPPLPRRPQPSSSTTSQSATYQTAESGLSSTAAFFTAEQPGTASRISGSSAYVTAEHGFTTPTQSRSGSEVSTVRTGPRSLQTSSNTKDPSTTATRSTTSSASSASSTSRSSMSMTSESGSTTSSATVTAITGTALDLRDIAVRTLHPIACEPVADSDNLHSEHVARSGNVSIEKRRPCGH